MGWGMGNIGVGTSLNFDVKAYPTEKAMMASTPKANTIGIITENKITSWEFSATEPSAPAEGMVWITVGTSSQVAFNVLKKNAVQVYPISAKQYVGGAWINVTAKSYQGGKWVDWITYLYVDGNQYEDITGGWVAVPHPNGGYDVAFTDNGIAVTHNGVDVAWDASAYTKNKIDVTNFSKLSVKVDADLHYTGGKLYVGLCTTNTRYMGFTDYFAFEEITKTGEYEVSVNLEGVSGEYYVGVSSQYILFTANDFVLS